jgi:hypothetical protein
VSTPEREGLIARVRQFRRSAAARGRPQAASDIGDPESAETRALEARLTHLEQLVQGLQDSVHRESERQSKRIGELEQQIKPGALGKALSNHARERGL